MEFAAEFSYGGGDDKERDERRRSGNVIQVRGGEAAEGVGHADEDGDEDGEKEEPGERGGVGADDAAGDGEGRDLIEEICVGGWWHGGSV